MNAIQNTNIIELPGLILLRSRESMYIEEVFTDAIWKEFGFSFWDVELV